MLTQLKLTSANASLGAILLRIHEKSFMDKLNFQSNLAKVLDVLFTDWDLEIYDENCYGKVPYSAHDVATLMTFGSQFDFRMADTVIIKNMYLETKKASVFNAALLDLVVAVAYKTFVNVDFLKSFNDKFRNLSLDDLGNVYCLETLSSKAS